MAAFTGSLQPKKKQELQDIALALNISDTGTRDDLQLRIKHHLSLNEAALAEDPRFAGLYGRARKKSVQPQLPAVKEDAASVSSEDLDDRARAHVRKIPRYAAPPNDSLARVATELDPADLPPLPPSPIPSAVAQAASAIGRDANALVQKVKQQERSIALEGRRLLTNTQAFLSDASNIYTLTLLAELFLLLYFAPVAHLRVPLNPPYTLSDPVRPASTLVASLRYPSPSLLDLARWTLPTLVVPQLCGALISFSTPPREVDPLTVGIVRVACCVAGRWGVDEHILPARWRLISASIGAAFAFAEAIGERRKAARAIRK